jgi:hypothetical protein
LNYGNEHDWHRLSAVVWQFSAPFLFSAVPVLLTWESWACSSWAQFWVDLKMFMRSCFSQILSVSLGRKSCHTEKILRRLEAGIWDCQTLRR